MWTIYALCVLLALAQCRGEDWKVVETQQGPVKGYLNKEGNYFEFLGIPYATAPKGRDKFKAPMDPPTWSGVMNATNGSIACLQPKMFSIDIFTMTEDCLVVNVFTPNTNKTNLPVMVMFQGDAFVIGAGNVDNHEWIIKEDIIVVDFNYRLGLYGFLNLGTEDVPGNAGMKDQVAALRWVQRNIRSFGGNPDDVTICGYSAGSASVEHLILSPMSKGLFKKAICESGSVFAPGAITFDPVPKAQRYMKDMSGNCSNDIKEIEEFFKSLTPEQLTEQFYPVETDSWFGSVVSVETSIEGEESFYTESPVDICLRGDYNKDILIMSGFASDGGLYREEVYDAWSKQMESSLFDFLPQNLIFCNDNEKNCNADKVDTFYFENGIVTLRKYVDYFTHILFGYPAIKSAEQHACNNVTVFLYYYSYIWSGTPHDVKLRGAGHDAQSRMLRTSNIVPPPNFDDNDLLMSQRLIKMYTEFAKFGTVTPSEVLPVDWKRVDPKERNYLHLDINVTMGNNLLGEIFEFWDSMYGRYRRQARPPSSLEKNCLCGDTKSAPCCE